MATRYVNYNVNSLGVTPTEMMWGGVQYEDNAVKVKYHIEKTFLASLGENISFRIDFSSESAGYDPSESLTLDEENCVERPITSKFTQYAGKMVSTLVITRIVDGLEKEELVFLPCTVYFTLAKREDQRIFNNLSACEQYVASLVTKADKSIEEAEKVLSDFYDALEENENNHEEYVKKTDFADKNGTPGVLRIKPGYGISSGRYGSTSPTSGDTIMIVTASNGEIRKRESVFKPITPSNIDYAVKVALTEPNIAWSESEKNELKTLLGLNSQTAVVENFSVGIDSYETYLPATEELTKGTTYKVSYFAGEYPGWIVKDQLPQKTKNTLSVTCNTVEIDGVEYLGFLIPFISWADGGTSIITVYQNANGLRIRRNFGGSDIISIFR